MVPIRGSAEPRRIPERFANFKMSGNTFLGRPTKPLGSKVYNVWILIRKMKIPKASLHIFAGLLSGFCFQVSHSNELSAAASYHAWSTSLPSHPSWFRHRNYVEGRSQWPRGLRFRSAAARLLRLRVRIPTGHGCLSVVNVLCCQVEVSATSWSLVQRSPAECGSSLCVT